MRFKFLTCEVFARQAYSIAASAPAVIDIELVDKGLHDTPDILRQELQKRLDALPDDRYDAILLGYGLCSNATVGIRCDKAKMVIPRTHDCIAVCLGSRERYDHEFREHPGTFWYTPDYLERGGSAGAITMGASDDDRKMTEVYAEYVDKYGRDNADYLMEALGAWRENYERSVYIDTPEVNAPDYRPQVRERAARRDWAFVEMAGSLVMLRDLLLGNWDEERFLVLAPGETLAPTYAPNVMDIATAEIGE